MLPNIRPTTRLLKDAGYATGVIGKLHVNTPHGFGWDYDDQRDDRDVRSMADRARRFIQGCGPKPWYLHYGFGDPHRLGAGFGNDRQYTGVTRAAFNPNSIRVPSFLPDNPEVRAEFAEYYQAANRLDQGVGFLLDVLRETGHLENTLVIFISDNGIPFANAKTNLYDAATHLPLIIWSPAQSRHGLVNNAMVSWTDIAPTILDWAGVKGPDYPLHGRSLLPVLEQENPAGWDTVFFSHTFHEVTMYFPMRGLRTRQFKYIRNLFPELEYPLATDLYSSRTWQSILRGGENALIGKRPVGLYLHRPYEELYDITRDPDEVDNLAPDPAYESTLKQLRAETHEFRSRTHDPWTLIGFYRGEPPGDSPEERVINQVLGQRKPAANERK
jgi:N-sulfoglucosamine sulfohydrolase